MTEVNIPRPEYPRPQFARKDWLNLNGPWQFEIDQGKSGRDRGLVEKAELEGSITVPFCPESALSGVGHRDFMNAVWYKRSFRLPSEWEGSRVLLHFGAVDYDAEAWVNGERAGSHRGGYSSFSFDITGLIRRGDNVLTVCAEDDVRGGKQPCGKQSNRYHSFECLYTRTTGIWQTVWLERVPGLYIASALLTPDAENGCLHIEALFSGHITGGGLSAEASFRGAPAGECRAAVSGRSARMTLPLSETHLWQPGSPNLYDLKLRLDANGQPDIVESYFGLRSVSWDGRAMLLNGKPVFQRLVIDQGYYPEGVYTAPSDEDLKRDIEISMGMGFNGARLHQKIFEPRYLYWADKLGYLVWGEHGNWGLDVTVPLALERFLPEWMEAVRRDYSHPCVVGWCPFNETRLLQDDNVIAEVYAVTKQLDHTRPVIDTSGYVHVVTDIYDVHDYDQNVKTFAERYAGVAKGESVYVNCPGREKYGGQPYFVSEFGGMWWNPGQAGGEAWGYGERPKTGEEFLSRFEGLAAALLNNPGVCAFCYTQLTDVEQEVNGLYTFDRRPKFDTGRIRKAVAAKAAIEGGIEK